jgi:enamine deaminase RidA (YjgF/YER057c/UK114 family)
VVRECLPVCGLIHYWSVIVRWLGIVLGTLRSAVRTHRELAREDYEFLKVPRNRTGIQLYAPHVDSPDGFQRAFETFTRNQVESVVIIPDPMAWDYRVHIGELAVAARLPTISQDRQFDDAGVLMSYGVNEVLFWRQAATFIDRILKGAKPGELAIEQPRKFDLVITSKPPKHSASRSRRRCCCGRIRWSSRARGGKFMSKQIVKTGSVAQPIGPYSLGVRSGNLVFVSGTVGWRPDGSAAADIKEQCHQMYKNVQQVLHAAGSSLDHVVTTTTYLVNEVRAQYFAADTPASAVVVVTMKAAVRLISRLLLPMRQSGWGRIVNVSSVAGVMPQPTGPLSEQGCDQQSQPVLD